MRGRQTGRDDFPCFLGRLLLSADLVRLGSARQHLPAPGAKLPDLDRTRLRDEHGLTCRTHVLETSCLRRITHASILPRLRRRGHETRCSKVGGGAPAPTRNVRLGAATHRSRKAAVCCTLMTDRAVISHWLISISASVVLRVWRSLTS